MYLSLLSWKNMIIKDKSISNFKLTNGMRVVFKQVPESKSVAIYLTVRAGPRYEEEKTSGLAHFLEHMLFEGTTRFVDAREVANYIESVGGRSGAWTDKEYVTYYVKVLPEHAERAIIYLSDILFNSRLDEKEIEKEKGIVIEEMKRKIDNPESESLDLWMEFVWDKTQSLGRSTIGDINTINKLNRKKILTYLKIFYFPSNMRMVVVGNFSKREARQYLKNYFNIKSKIKLPTPFPVSYYPKKNRIKFIQSNIEQVQIVFGFVTNVNYFNEDKYAIMLIAEILGGSTASRLFYQLVYKLGIAYTSVTYPWSFKDTGLFISYTAVSPANAYKAVNQIFKEINKIKQKLISDTELKSNKEKIRARFYYDMETTDAIAYLYSTQLATEGKITTQEEIINKIKSVKSADLLRIAKKYLKSENLNILIRGKIDLNTRQKIEEELRQI